MPLQHDFGVYGVHDAKIRLITADPPGGAPTYGPTIDVPGIKSVGITGDVTSAELRGDNRRLGFRASLSGIGLSFQWAKQSLDVLAVLLGGTVADSGVTPAQIASLALTAENAQPRFFDFRALSTGVDMIGGGQVITASKCIISGFPEFGFAEEDFQTLSVDAGTLPLDSTGAWIDVSAFETAPVLA